MKEIKNLKVFVLWPLAKNLKKTTSVVGLNILICSKMLVKRISNLPLYSLLWALFPI